MAEESAAAEQPLNGLKGAIALFRETSFGRLWFAGAGASVLRWLESLAVGVYVFDATDSPFLVAIFLFLRWAPLLLLGALIGAIADRVSRKSILLGALAVMTLNAGVLGLLLIFDAAELWHIGLGAFLSGIYTATEFSTRRAMIGETAGPHRLGIAMAIDAGTSNGTRMLGPALGGLLLEFVGLHGAYFLGFVVYGTGFVSVLGLDYEVVRGPAVKMLGNLVAGIRYVRGEPRILGVLAITVIVNAFGFPFASVLPVIGRDTLGLSAFPVGLLASSEGFGALLGALFVAATVRPSRYDRYFVFGSLIFLTGILFFALSTSFPLSLAVLIMTGIGIAGFSSMQSTILLSSATPEVRGRVMGLLAVSVGTMPLGILHAGFLADRLGAAPGMTIVAAEGLVLWVAAAIYWRRKVTGRG